MAGVQALVPAPLANLLVGHVVAVEVDDTARLLQQSVDLVNGKQHRRAEEEGGERCDSEGLVGDFKLILTLVLPQ